MEGSGRGLIEYTIPYLPEKTDSNHKKNAVSVAGL
jgi:hypothetical protein